MIIFLGLEEGVDIIPSEDLVPHEGEDEEGAEDAEGRDEERLLVEEDERVEEEQNKRLFVHSDQHVDTWRRSVVSSKEPAKRNLVRKAKRKLLVSEEELKWRPGWRKVSAMAGCSNTRLRPQLTSVPVTLRRRRRWRRRLWRRTRRPPLRAFWCFCNLGLARAGRPTALPGLRHQRAGLWPSIHKFQEMYSAISMKCRQIC